MPRIGESRRPTPIFSASGLRGGRSVLGSIDLRTNGPG
jgi:hypothetical protein